MIRFLLAALLILTAFEPSMLQAAPDNLFCFSRDGGYCNVVYFRPVFIDERLATELETIERFGSHLESVYFSSTGGDVQAAMRIGRLLRRQKSSFWSTSCASACVIAAAGAVRRVTATRDGVFIIHRPYAATAAASFAEAQSRLNQFNRMLASYFNEMNMPSSLLEAMNAVSPDESRTLIAKEAQAIGLVEFDPAYEDFVEGKLAKSLNVSRREILNRIAKRKNECDPLTANSDFKAYAACLQRVGLANARIEPKSARPFQTISWDEAIARTPDWQRMSPDDRETVRNAYWKIVVAPVIPAEQLDAAREAFDSDTAPKPRTN